MRLIRNALTLAICLAAAAPAAAADKLTVLLDWFVNPDHATLIVAKQQGIFAKHGLEVELVAPADPNAPPRLVAAGHADLAVTYQPNLHLQISEGLPVTRIGTLVDTPLNALVAIEGKGVAKIADLKGKTVGYSIGGFEEALLGSMLEAHGLKYEDVKTVNVNFALTPALMAGQVDAVIGAFRNFELTQIKLAGGTGIAFFPEENGVPLYDELILVAHKDKARDPRLPRFLAALEEATTFVLNHPEEGWKAFVAAEPKLDDELNRRAYDLTRPRFAKSPAVLDTVRYREFGRFMQARGLVKTVPPLESYAIDPRS
jgi:putative hydroxymethylpyrimidine transport system substrate-binding protein